MKFTFVIPYDGVNGGIRVVSDYARELIRRGHSVTVVHRMPPSTWRHKIRSGLARLSHRTLDSRSFLASKGIPTILARVDNEIPAEIVPDADVVVATWWETARWVATYPASKGTKVYLIQHDERVFHQGAEVEATWHLPMRRIVVARWLADLLESHGVERPHVIENAVDHQQFSVGPRQPAKPFRVGFLYSHWESKGADVAIKALQMIQGQIPNMQVVMLGDKRLCHKVPVGAKYYRSPPQRDIPTIYASCGAWLFCSRSEGFGLPILEAMACGTPVIGTKAGAAPELLASGGGWLLDRADPDAFATMIVRMAMLSENDWLRMSDAARAEASHRTWSTAVDAFLRIVTA